MSITLAIAQARLTSYLDAEAAVLEGQETRSADGRLLRMADLKEIRAGITHWAAEVDRLQAGAVTRGPRVYGVTVGN